MRSLPLLSLVSLIAVTGGCSENPVRVDRGVSPVITQGAGAHDGSSRKTYGTSRRLRRMERMHRFVYCDARPAFNGFAKTASMVAELRPRRAVTIAEDRCRSRERWEHLCGFDLRRNTDRIEEWVAAVHRRRDADGAFYRKWLVSESRNPRLAARALQGVLVRRGQRHTADCLPRSVEAGGDQALPVGGMSPTRRGWRRRGETLRELCRPDRNAGDGVLRVHGKARESEGLGCRAVCGPPYVEGDAAGRAANRTESLKRVVARFLAPSAVLGLLGRLRSPLSGAITPSGKDRFVRSAV